MGKGSRTEVTSMSTDLPGTFDVLGFGDVHRHYGLVRRAARREGVRAPFTTIFTVGDFSDSTKHEAEDPEQVRDLPIVRCHGNHEDWRNLEKLPGHFVADGQVYLDPPTRLRTLAFGGVYVARNWEADSRAWKDQERKAFTRREWELAKAARNIDVLLTHEAGSYISNFYVSDVGQTLVRDLVDTVRPKLHLCGHHHHLTVCRWKGVIGMMLPIPTTGWVRIHFESHLPVSYSVARLDDKSYELVADHLPFPQEGEVRVGMPDSDKYFETKTEVQLIRPAR